MKRLGLILILIFAVHSFGQQQFVFDFKKRIFLDDFEDNRFEWIIPEVEGLNSIKDGFLFYSNPYDFDYLDGKPVFYDQLKDFILQTKFKVISGDVEEFSGLFFGDLIFGSKYTFTFSPMGYFRVVKHSNLEEQELIREKLDQINRSDFNVLTVVKQQDKYIFYINGVKVFETKFTRTGPYIGFVVAPKSYVQIAYLKLFYL